MSLLGTAIVGVLKRKAAKSVTSWLGAAITAGGTAAALDPDLVALIPEGARGWIMAVIGLAVIVGRHRTEIIAAWAQLRAEVKAAEAAAEKETGGQ